MKTLFKTLSIFALAVMLAWPAGAGEYSFPAGVSFKHVVGKTLDPSGSRPATGPSQAGTYTTIDFIDFGFDSTYVRICLRLDSVVSYFRFATTITTSTDVFNTALRGNGMAWYDSGTAADFINGVTSADYGAMSMTTPTSVDGANILPGSTCITQPWQTRGLLMHIASGQATADVWGYR